MKKYTCKSCWYTYDPEVGDPKAGIAPGTPFEELPEDWFCPVCMRDKSAFAAEEETKAAAAAPENASLDRYKCPACWYIYDPRIGDPLAKIPPTVSSPEPALKTFRKTGSAPSACWRRSPSPKSISGKSFPKLLMQEKNSMSTRIWPAINARPASILMIQEAEMQQETSLLAPPSSISLRPGSALSAWP